MWRPAAHTKRIQFLQREAGHPLNTVLIHVCTIQPDLKWDVQTENIVTKIQFTISKCEDGIRPIWSLR